MMASPNSSTPQPPAQPVPRLPPPRLAHAATAYLPPVAAGQTGARGIGSITVQIGRTGQLAVLARRSCITWLVQAVQVNDLAGRRRYRLRHGVPLRVLDESVTAGPRRLQ